MKPTKVQRPQEEQVEIMNFQERTFLPPPPPQITITVLETPSTMYIAQLCHVCHL